jgi:phosphoribosylanthranilate isomerase
MNNIKIKICGIKDSETAIFCIEEGVDFLGFNFSPVSSRFISLKDSEIIINTIYKNNYKNKFEIIGLFFKTSEEVINDVIKSGLFNSFQYVVHDPNFNRKLYDNLKLIPQIGIENEVTDSDLNYTDDLLILDSYNKSSGGGSGSVFPWQNIKKVKRKYLLAGGLNPENVSSAIETLNPYGVDVASGVEDSPGVKNHEKIRRFIENARR